MSDVIEFSVPNLVPANYRGKKKKRRGLASGVVTPPTDFQPAIDALTDIGRAYLKRETKGRDITPRDLARAADYERGELTNG